MAHRRNKSYLSTCCQKMSLAYQIEETVPEGEVLEGGKRRGNIQQCAFSPVHTNTHTYTYTNTLERHGAVVSWQTNDRQMTRWNTSTRPDTNRPVRLCQWHLLWREREREERNRETGEGRARPVCHFTQTKPLPNTGSDCFHRRQLCPI